MSRGPVRTRSPPQLQQPPAVDEMRRVAMVSEPADPPRERDPSAGETGTAAR